MCNKQIYIVLFADTEGNVVCGLQITMITGLTASVIKYLQDTRSMWYRQSAQKFGIDDSVNHLKNV